MRPAIAAYFTWHASNSSVKGGLVNAGHWKISNTLTFAASKAIRLHWLRRWDKRMEKSRPSCGEAGGQLSRAFVSFAAHGQH